MKKSKRAKKISQIVEENQKLNTVEAIELLKKCPKLKFDESIEMSIKLGVDPKKSDQQVRGKIGRASCRERV